MDSFRKYSRVLIATASLALLITGCKKELLEEKTADTEIASETADIIELPVTEDEPSSEAVDEEGTAEEIETEAGETESSETGEAETESSETGEAETEGSE
nr:hypothetical protein [Lachnospiraceae bacterium]